jgi:hypothetical protein
VRVKRQGGAALQGEHRCFRRYDVLKLQPRCAALAVVHEPRPLVPGNATDRSLELGLIGMHGHIGDHEGIYWIAGGDEPAQSAVHSKDEADQCDAVLQLANSKLKKQEKV